jgi:hypothetical protein
VFLLSLPLVTARLRGADEIEYFSYLRSLVFDHDVELGNEYQHFYERDPIGLQGFKATFLDLREPATGAHINFAPVGSAILWAPSYLVAHACVSVARGFGASVAADGYSRPYVAATCLASALLGFLGLLLTRDALIRYDQRSDATATLAVLACWLATPLVYYMTVAPGFAHATSVFAVALLVWLSLRVLARGEASLRDWALLGASVGLAALVYEKDALFVVVPAGVLLRVSSQRGLRAIGLGGVTAAVTSLLVFAPQFLVYRALNGSFGPSHMVARKMSYSSPHFSEVLLDPAHGLFFWTPILVLASLGLVASLVVRRDLVSLLFTAALVLQAWINGSLESWSQAGAFGSRRFVSVTPVFAFGLAAVLAWLLPRIGRVGGALLVGVFCWWNVSLMVQFGLKLMDRQRLEWPKVAVQQFTSVPARLGRTAYLYLVDRERLVEETR